MKFAGAFVLSVVSLWLVLVLYFYYSETGIKVEAVKIEDNQSWEGKIEGESKDEVKEWTEWRKSERHFLSLNECYGANVVVAKIEGQVFLFELYFVEVPEAYGVDTVKVFEQKEYFNFQNNDDFWKSKAEEARRGGSDLLGGGQWVIRTKWEKVPERQRYYAMVQVTFSNGEQQDYGQWLLRQGYGWIHGRTVDVAPQLNGIDYLAQLKPLINYARREKLGFWNQGERSQ
jgi:hypothetical protein